MIKITYDTEEEKELIIRTLATNDSEYPIYTANCPDITIICKKCIEKGKKKGELINEL